MGGHDVDGDGAVVAGADCNSRVEIRNAHYSYTAEVIDVLADERPSCWCAGNMRRFRAY